MRGTAGRRSTRVGMFVAGALALALSVASCASPAGSGGTLAEIKSSGVARVGFANEAPFAYSTSDGQLAGFMPAAMTTVFSGMGDIKLEGVLAEFSGLIPGVQAGRFDLVGAGLYINPERCQQALPSNPVYTAAEGMAVKTGNPLGIASYADLVSKGARFGTVTGSINLTYATDAGFKEADVVLFPDVPSALAALEAGRVDAVGMSAISLQNVMTNTKATAVQLADPFSPPEGANAYGAVYFNKDDKDLVDAFNAELAKAVESGALLKAYEDLGFGKELLPPADVTAEQLCAG